MLDEAGAVIPGLYAAGNTTASVMGRTYPGPGSTIAPAVIFGYLGALHAAEAEILTASTPSTPHPDDFTDIETTPEEQKETSV